MWLRTINLQSQHGSCIPFCPRQHITKQLNKPIWYVWLTFCVFCMHTVYAGSMILCMHILIWFRFLYLTPVCHRIILGPFYWSPSFWLCLYEHWNNAYLSAAMNMPLAAWALSSGGQEERKTSSSFIIERMLEDDTRANERSKARLDGQKRED